MTAAELGRWERWELEYGLLGPSRDDFLAAQQAFYVLAAAGAKKVDFTKLLVDWVGKPSTRDAEFDEDDEPTDGPPGEIVVSD